MQRSTKVRKEKNPTPSHDNRRLQQQLEIESDDFFAILSGSLHLCVEKEIIQATQYSPHFLSLTITLFPCLRGSSQHYSLVAAPLRRLTIVQQGLSFT